MKVYVSENDVIFGNSNQLHLKIIEDRPSMFMPTEKELTKKPSIYTLPIHSLEQHDNEIRKPLEDEIKRLKFESENIQKAIQHVDDAKYNAQQDDIEFFVKQAKQEVIDEMLEWASYKIRDYDTSIPRLEMINGFIKKLNQIKEVE